MSLGFFGLERLSGGEIALVVIALVLVFGARRIPEIARALGRSINEFKKGQQEGAKPDAASEQKTDQSETPQ